MHPRSPSSVPVPGLFAAALLLLAGCQSTTYTVQVDAISQPAAVAPETPEPRSYRVRSRNPRVDEDSLRYHEVSGYIKTALSGKGLYEAPSAETADLIIEIDYGMETPRMKYETVSKPVVMVQEGLSARESAAAVSARFRTPRSMPVTKVVGFMEEMEPVVVYEKYLKVSARANREAVEGQPAPEVWSVNVSAEDASDEVRKYMPILASATADFIGTNTRQEKKVNVREADESVKFVKKGL